jgi:cell division protein FtsA
MDANLGNLGNNMRKNLSRTKNGIIAGLDVGCSKICCFIARVDQGPLPRVIGIG